MQATAGQGGPDVVNRDFGGDGSPRLGSTRGSVPLPQVMQVFKFSAPVFPFIVTYSHLICSFADSKGDTYIKTHIGTNS
jgi:hypothetical protein